MILLLLCLGCLLASIANAHQILVRLEHGNATYLWAQEIAARFNITLITGLEQLGHPYYLFEANSLEEVTELLKKDSGVEHVRWALVEHHSPRNQRLISFDDPVFKNMWHMNEINWPRSSAFLDIPAAWNMGYSGKGVTVGILDNGIDVTNTDLKDNYRPEASLDKEKNLMMGYRPGFVRPNHGTACAGIIAAKGNNDFCGVGVAYESGIGNLVFDDMNITDAIEAKTLSHGATNGLIDIYLLTFGPLDDGTRVVEPRSMTKRALRVGMLSGRHGNGAVHVFAAGNGGQNNDHCGADGYTNNIYIITVNGIASDRFLPSYGERCASIMTTAFAPMLETVVDTNFQAASFGGRCSIVDAGTSVAASIVSGIISLGYEANPDLTWRDVDYLIVLASRHHEDMDIASSQFRQWTTNGAGFDVHDAFGFGMINAGSYVKMAKRMKEFKLPEQHECIVLASNITSEHPVPIKAQTQTTIILDSNTCSQIRPVTSLEHVQLLVTIKPYKHNPAQRGKLQVIIESAQGTQIPLLLQRTRDTDTKVGYHHWTFMSVLFWFEDPRGDWKMTFKNFDQKGHFLLTEIKLILRGVQSI